MARSDSVFPPPLRIDINIHDLLPVDQQRLLLATSAFGTERYL